FEEAVTLLEDVLSRDIPELRPTAKYYLAEAHVSTYRPKDIERADELLQEVIGDTAASLSDHLRAEGLRIFNYIRQTLWRKRTKPFDLSKEEGFAAQRLKDHKVRLDDPKVKGELKASLWADYWNAEGLLQEFRANREQDGSVRTRLIQGSLTAFRKAVEYGTNRADAKSNEARVQYELLRDAAAATRLCREVLAIRKNDSFANLLLGKISEDSGRQAEALSFYLSAEAKFPEATLGTGRCYESLDKVQEAVIAYGRIPESDRRFGEANFRAGALLESLGRTKDALSAYERVPKSDEVFSPKAQQAIKLLEMKS
ncbi:MAG: hypothetical protein WA639_21580, partial [Candidatus Acidiferrum sp.]